MFDSAAGYKPVYLFALGCKLCSTREHVVSLPFCLQINIFQFMVLWILERIICSYKKSKHDNPNKKTNCFQNNKY